MNKTLNFKLELTIDIDGRIPSDEVLISRVIEAMNDKFPSIMFNDEDIDCAVLVNNFSWEYLPE